MVHKDGASHLTIDPKILYIGTPVALVTTMNPDGHSCNIGPMSSVWALGHTIVQGWERKAWTLDNLERERECVINVPDPDLVEQVERLAPLTGRNPVPESMAGTFRHHPDKFAASGLTPAASDTVTPPRIEECPLQLEAVVTAVHVPASPDGDRFRIVETHVQRVHAHKDLVPPGTNHIDPSRWSPLLYVFRHYFGTGPELGRTFRAEY